MAKTLTPKTQAIREAILAHPDTGPKALAQLINNAEEREADGVHVTPGEVASQQQAMRRTGASLPAKPAEEPRPAKKPRPEPEPVAEEEEAPPPRKERKAPARKPDLLDLLDKVVELATECGGIGELKRIVDRLIELRGR